MGSTAPGFAEMKKGMKAAWMAGDFGQIARHNQWRGEEFVSRLGLKPGIRVLDVGCGTGNQSIPAARTGADMTGVDIATNLIEQAGKRAEEERLKIRFVEGDAEQLPFGAGGVRRGLFHVRSDVRAASGTGSFGIRARVQAGRINRHGQLDAGWIHRADVQDRQHACASATGRPATNAMGRRGGGRGSDSGRK